MPIIAFMIAVNPYPNANKLFDDPTKPVFSNISLCLARSAATKLKKEKNFKPDIVFSSLMLSARKTAEEMLFVLGTPDVPIIKNWRLVATKYGTKFSLNELVGNGRYKNSVLQNSEINLQTAQYLLAEKDECYPLVAKEINTPKNPRPTYQQLKKQTPVNTVEYWKHAIHPEIEKKKNVMVVSHDENIHHLLPHILKITPDEFAVILGGDPSRVPPLYAICSISTCKFELSDRMVRHYKDTELCEIFFNLEGKLHQYRYTIKENVRLRCRRYFLYTYNFIMMRSAPHSFIWKFVFRCLHLEVRKWKCKYIVMDTRISLIPGFDDATGATTDAWQRICHKTQCKVFLCVCCIMGTSYKSDYSEQNGRMDEVMCGEEVYDNTIQGISHEEECSMQFGRAFPVSNYPDD